MDKKEELLKLEQKIKRARIEDIGLDLLGNKIKKRPISPDYNGICPFHLETHPSFYLKVKWNRYVCFGCHMHGGPLDLPFALSNDDEKGLSYLEKKFCFNRENIWEMAIVKMSILEMLKKSEREMWRFEGEGWTILEEFEPFYREGEGDLIQVYSIVVNNFDNKIIY